MGSLFQKNSTTKSSQSTAPPDEVMQQYRDLLNRATNASYGSTVAGFQPLQQQAFDLYSQIPNQYLPQAEAYAQQGASPISEGDISRYYNPYQQSVIDATMGNMAEQNAQQQKQVVGNALGQGALGGNRVAVAQAELARQQGLSNAQTLAGLNASNYQQALGAAQADRSAAAQGANTFAGLQSSALQGAQGLLGAGTLQQQQATQELTQPYQQASWLASILGGLGPLMGSTTKGSQTTPQAGLLQSLLGAGTTLAGMFANAGGRVKGYTDGGGIFVPTLPSYDPIKTSQMLTGPDMSESQAQSSGSTANTINGISSLLSGLGGLFGSSAFPTFSNTASQGFIYKDGGAVRRFADGGYASPMPLVQNPNGVPIPGQMNAGRPGGNLNHWNMQVSGLSKLYPAAQAMSNMMGYIGGPGGRPQFGANRPGIGQSPMQGSQRGGAISSDLGRMSQSALDIANHIQRSMHGGQVRNPGIGRRSHFDDGGIAVLPSAFQADEFDDDGQISFPSIADAGIGLPAYKPVATAPVLGSDKGQGIAVAPQSAGAPMDLTPNLSGAAADMPEAAQPEQKMGRHPWSMPLMAAGLGILASRSPNLGVAIGEGGLAGLNAYMQTKKSAADQALAEREFGLKQRSADLEAKRLDQAAENEAKRLALESRRVDLAAGTPSSPIGKLERDYRRGLIDEESYKAARAALGSGATAMEMPGVPLSDSGTPDPQAQAQFLGSLDPSMASLVKSVADYHMPIEKVTSLRGNQRQQLAAIVSQYDPTFDMTQYNTRAAMRKSVTSGNYSNALNSANLVIQHANALLKSAEAMKNGPWRTGNRLVNLFKEETGDPTIAAFKTARDAVAAEAAKVFKGVGATDLTSIQEWQHNLDTASSPAQIKASIHTLIGDLLKSRLDTIESQYKSAMGKPTDFDFLTPHSKEILQGLGIAPSELDPKASNESGSTEDDVDALVKKYLQ